MSIEIRNVTKLFGNFRALNDVSLEVQSGELLALLGPSGCGKTTLLRIIAGLESAQKGSIFFSGEDKTDQHIRSRQVGFVFQHYALFRHMTVAQNVAFGLRMRARKLRPSNKEIEEKVASLLALMQLDRMAQRYPSQLSGGQRQRVALARALAVEPKVLLLDEPFGALDAKVRKELRRWLRRLHDDLHVTSIFVTHDQEEALEVADRVVVMNRGEIEQIGTPEQVWESPASAFVYSFLGDVNQLRGMASSGHFTVPGSWNIDAPEHINDLDVAALAFVRPTDLVIAPYQAGSPGVVARLDRVLVVGPVARLELSPLEQPNEILEAHLPRQEFAQLGVKQGDQLLVATRRAKVFLHNEDDPAVLI